MNILLNETKYWHRLLFGIFTLSLVAACANTIHKTSQDLPPRWFSNLPVQPDQLIGYGEGATRSIALDQARGDLGRQIEVKITSEQNISIRDENGEVHRKATQKNRSQSQQRFKQLKLFKQQQTPAGYHYVAVLLDLRPLEQIIADSLKTAWHHQTPKNLEWSGPSALVQSELIRAVTKRLALTEPGEEARQVNVSLLRRQGQWVLNVGENNYVLDSQQLSRIVHFSNDQLHHFQLNIVTKDKKSANRLNAGDHFYLALNSD